MLRGYASESFAHAMAEAIRYALHGGKQIHIYQLGDHDPSGVDAWRDFREKVTAFLGQLAEPTYDEVGNQWEPVVFERLAVTEQQITSMQLPTRPTKGTDTRSAMWTGGGSVEVDAGLWAREHGLALNARGHPDWDALRVLLDGPEALRSAARRAGQRKGAAVRGAAGRVDLAGRPPDRLGG